MKRSEVTFLRARHVLSMHDEALTVAPGLPGVRDPGMLESAVNAPENAYLGSLAELASAYAHGIAKGHAFVDGNKRTAVYAMLAFLEVNGFALTLPDDAWEVVINGVAAGSVTRDELAKEIALELGRRHGLPGFPLWVDLEEDEYA